MNNGGPAFPIPDNSPYDGMTLRDYFAAKALCGWLASFTDANGIPPLGPTAELCYQLADAMLKEREKGGTE